MQDKMLPGFLGTSHSNKSISDYHFLHFSLFSARLESVTKDSDGFLVRECEFNINLHELQNLN